ncbi:hypothetical protein F4776DRAFT_610776 [Hypoxylon sp. NC0597]|nr:hypothetical protein F4776DRAFT_610776 [Hypoxylon sp. NC0597]
MSQEQGGLIRPHQAQLPSTGADIPHLLKLPLELIFMISEEFLEPASALALSLTCKGLSAAIFPKSRRRLGDDDRREFLRLLEKDVSRQRPTHYCDDCVCLHYFDPTRDDPTIHPQFHMFQYSDCRRNSLHLPGTSFVFGYHHARLLTNQYLYGAPHAWFASKFGIPTQHGPHSPHWTQTWSANVINGELFLSATHTVRFVGNEDDFRRSLDENDYNICRHVGTRKSFRDLSNPGEDNDSLFLYWQRFGNLVNTIHITNSASFTPAWSSRRVINAFRLERGASIPIGHRFLRLCKDVRGSCSFCATDYTTTLEKGFVGGFGPLRHEWTLTIVTYHQLGDCRSPYDARWAAFRGYGWNCFSSRDREKIFGSLPGDVKAKWESGVQRYQ